MERQGIRSPGRLMVQQLGRDHFDQFVRITVKLSKLPVERLDELIHLLPYQLSMVHSINARM